MLMKNNANSSRELIWQCGLSIPKICFCWSYSLNKPHRSVRKKLSFSVSPTSHYMVSRHRPNF